MRYDIILYLWNNIIYELGLFLDPFRPHVEVFGEDFLFIQVLLACWKFFFSISWRLYFRNACLGQYICIFNVVFNKIVLLIAECII